MVIKIYADKECKKPIETVEWNKEVTLTLVDNTKTTIQNAIMAGEMASTVIYLRNESPYKFAVTKVSFSDPRVKCKIAAPWLNYNIPVEMEISFEVPDNPKPEDVIKAGQVKVDGIYIYN